MNDVLGVHVVEREEDLLGDVRGDALVEGLQLQNLVVELPALHHLGHYVVSLLILQQLKYSDDVRVCLILINNQHLQSPRGPSTRCASASQVCHVFQFWTF